jgi:hypothetical protein
VNNRRNTQLHQRNTLSLSICYDDCSMLIFISYPLFFFGQKARIKLFAWLIGEGKKWTWMLFVVYMKVRNRHECRMPLKFNGYWFVKYTRSQWAVWIWIWQRDIWSRNRFATVHASETRVIEKEMNSKISSKSRTTKDVAIIACSIGPLFRNRDSDTEFYGSRDWETLKKFDLKFEKTHIFINFWIH